MKKVIIQAVILSIIAFVAGWFLWPFEFNFLFEYCKGINPEVLFHETKMNGAFILVLKNATTWLALPWIAFLTHFAINKFKLIEWSLKRFYMILCVEIFGYLTFAGLCLLVVRYAIKNAADYSISPLIKNEFTMDVPNINTWGIWGAVIFCGICFLFVKKKNLVHN